MSDLYTVGLTGSTGAGKSEVARLMAQCDGWIIVDADVISRRVVEVGQPTLFALTKRFSADILRQDGSLNRQALADKAFASPEETAALNAIMHPAIIREIRRELNDAARKGYRVAVIDAPLLLQTGLDAICDCTVAVISTFDLRCERIRLRDGLTAEQAAQRMSTQPSDDYYKENVTYLIVNIGDRQSLITSTQALCQRIEGAVS